MIETSNVTTHRSLAPTVYMPVPAPLFSRGTLAANAFREPVGSPAPTDGTRSYEERYRIEGDLGDGLYLHHQLPVRVWLEGAEFVAEQPELRLHSFGQDQTEAILNLRDEIVDHYRRLEEMGDHVSPALSRDRAMLRKLLGMDA